MSFIAECVLNDTCSFTGLLPTHPLRRVLTETGRLLLAFLLGAVATVAGSCAVSKACLVEPSILAIHCIILSYQQFRRTDPNASQQLGREKAP